jgi:hypothetical protein
LLLAVRARQSSLTLHRLQEDAAPFVKGIFMNKIILMAAVAFAGGGFAAQAQDTAPSADATTRKAEKMVCKTVGETGSRLKRSKVCRTAAQWAEQRQIDRANIDRSQTQQMNKSGN